MQSPARGALRVLRAAVLALLALAVSAGGHVLAGGSLPDPGRLALLALATGAVCLAVTRWRLSPMAAAGLLGGSQLVLHEALMGLAPAARSSMHLGGHLGAQGIGQDIGLGSADLPMVLAHAGAAVVLALVYARGEDALWGLWTWLAPLVAVVVVLSRAPVVARPVPAVERAVAPRTRPELLGALSRRGPPPVALATA